MPPVGCKVPWPSVRSPTPAPLPKLSSSSVSQPEDTHIFPSVGQCRDISLAWRARSNRTRKMLHFGWQITQMKCTKYAPFITSLPVAHSTDVRQCGYKCGKNYEATSRRPQPCALPQETRRHGTHTTLPGKDDCLLSTPTF